MWKDKPFFHEMGAGVEYAMHWYAMHNCLLLMHLMLLAYDSDTIKVLKILYFH